MYKLLVIESEGESRDRRVALLRKNSFEVIVTAQISDGLALALQKPPDLILAALDLSGASNYQLLQAVRVKSELTAIPIIVITQNSDRDYQRQCITLGADDCLVMPFSDDVLMGAIAIRLRKQDALTQRYNTLMRHTAERLNRLSHYDSLTDLPNYHLLQQRLMLAINRAAVSNQRVALLSLSLDRLRQINNTLGFAAGDTLLQATAQRLTGILPASTAVARLTGNQFAIVLPTPKHRQDVAAIAEEVMDSLSRSFSLPEHTVFVTTSVGIAMFPDDAQDISTLLRQADAALDWAKSQKSNSYRFYHSDMPVVSGDELQLETRLRYAVERQEFEVRYQPKQSLKTGRIEGAEALIRWHHADHGYVSPARFIPLAEETGLITPIGEWMLRTVCAQTARWLAQGLPPVKIAVNLSSVQLNQSQLCDVLKQILSDTGLPTQSLELEVTETALMQDVTQALGLLHQLKDLGVGLAIDDFGTGYASLGYLRELPIDSLKIDTCFVRGVDRDPKNQAILQRIIGLAHDLKLLVVAEGVETAAELELLRGYKCDLVQGYLVGAPMAAAQLEAVIQ